MAVASVIISSTGLDLCEYRKAAEAICLEMDLFPIAMEYFEAMGVGATEGSLRKVDQADVLVGIYAHRYGYIEPGRDRSVTEIEYDRAGERGIERLCFVVDPKWPWPPEAWDYANHPKLLAFKDRIGATLIRGQFTTVDDLRVKVTQALMQWKARYGRTDTGAGQEHAAPRVSNVPAPPALLIGRDEDLSSLRARLCAAADGSARLTVLRGWPGVGKTTMVNAIAHDEETLRRFPDGVLWVALGQQPNPVGGLQGWADVLGAPPTSRQRSLDELMNEVRAGLRERRMLLIIDDVWKADDAAPFKLGGTQCATLMTTRLTEVALQLAPTPGDVVQLGQLSEAASMDLMARLAPTVRDRHPQDCRLVVNDLEGLPLAIRVAARLLETEASLGWGVADLARELSSGKLLLSKQAPDDRLDPVTGAIPTLSILLKQSTDRLDPVTRDRYAFLGVFAPKPATFDLEAMQAVWEAPDIEDTKATVRTLADRGLLEPLIGHGRFQVHAVLVMHAKSLLTD
jgi:hypothetical protein